jgi:GH24 family phage-related lysozyme (muramidase)
MWVFLFLLIFIVYMKIILTESQIKTLSEAAYDDPDFIDYIKNVEGKVIDPNTGLHKAYKDNVGVVTIGYGHSEKADPSVKLGMKIPEKKAIRYLQNDIKQHENIVKDYVSKRFPGKKLDDEQLKMLVDFSFNAGLTKFPKFTKAVVLKDWDSVKNEYKRYAGGKELKDRNDRFYNKFLRNKGSKKQEVDNVDHGKSIIGQIVYPRNRSHTNYTNVRTSPEVNTGLFHNLQLKVTWPNAIGKVKSEKVINGITWYEVILPKGVGNGMGLGWVRFDNVTTNKNSKYVN